MSCARPSAGIALMFATIGFGIDRFYVGQAGVGIALLIGYLTIFGTIVAIPVEWLSALSLVIAIFSNRVTAFMYGGEIVFEPPTVFDKIIAVVWIILWLAVIGGTIVATLTVNNNAVPVNTLQ